MRTYRDTIILDQPLVADYTLIGNGYINISMTFPEENNRTATFWKTDILSTKVLRFSAANYNIKFKVLGSLDSLLTFSETAIPETTLVVGTPYTIELSKYYTALKIQVCPDSLNNFGTFSATLTGNNLPLTKSQDEMLGNQDDMLINQAEMIANQVIMIDLLDVMVPG